MFKIMKVLLALCLLGWANNVAAQQQPVHVVQVAKVLSTKIAPTVSVTGTIYSRHDVQITAGVAGLLEYVPEPGTLVSANDVVARIDSTPLQLQREEQVALLERSSINVRQLDIELRRQGELAESKLVSEFQLEQTETNRDLAKVDARIIQIKIRQIEDQIARAETRARFSGVVTERMHRAGEHVAPGEALARMTDLVNREVRAFVPLKYLARAVTGEKIEVFVDDLRTMGTIRALIPTGDVRSQTFEASIDLPDSARTLWAVGQLVSVSVPVTVRRQTLAIPRDALVLRQNGQYVYRITDDNRAVRVFVDLGTSQGSLIAITGQIQEGDRVAIRGAESLADGVEVEILATAPAQANSDSNKG